MAFATINKGSSYFDTKLYTGTGSSQSITGLNFAPDFVWIKDRTSANNHRLFDIIRGATKELYSSTNDAEVTQSQSLTSFNSDGFTVGTLAQVNTNGNNYVSWNWDANGAGVSNTQGNLTSTVSANTTSGFTVLSYTTNSTANRTIGHGLGVAPAMIIIKNKSAVSDWAVYHQSLGNTKWIRLNSTDVAYTASDYWNNTSPTSTVFTIGATNTNVNDTSGNTYAAYCFAEVKGFSKFGSFNGNGSADGTFVYTGFKPAFIIQKITSETGSWFVFDSKRNGYNGGNNYLYPNASDAELTTQLIDITSNGFKQRFAGGANSSGTSIYMAFAENPFVLTDGTPVTAR